MLQKKLRCQTHPEPNHQKEKHCSVKGIQTPSQHIFSAKCTTYREPTAVGKQARKISYFKQEKVSTALQESSVQGVIYSKQDRSSKILHHLIWSSSSTIMYRTGNILVWCVQVVVRQQGQPDENKLACAPRGILQTENAVVSNYWLHWSSGSAEHFATMSHFTRQQTDRKSVV